MNIEINGATVSEARLDRWKEQRIARVLRVFGQKARPSSDLCTETERLTELKLGYSYDELCHLLGWRLTGSSLGVRCLVWLSGKRRRCAVTVLRTDGISAKECAEKIDAFMTLDDEPTRRINLGACPDHYVLRPLGDDRLEVIETCGNSPFPFQFFIAFGDQTGLVTPRDPSYPYQSTGTARTKSGVLMGGVRHQFRDTETGLEAKLTVEFPGWCPSWIVRAHQMHLACEFSYWIAAQKEV